MGNKGNELFQEILAQINANYEKGLIEQYKALENIYLKCYNKYLEEKQAKQSAKVEQKIIDDTSKQGVISQKTNETEPSTSFFGDLYEPAYNKMMQEQKMPKFQIQDHCTIVASDIHGNIEDFLKILLENDLIILENSYQLVDLETLESYDTFASFEKKVQNEDDKISLDKISIDARCVILPKFELNKDIDITFNYLGDLIDEGRFSIECFYMMMLLMEKAKSCGNFEINYIAGNHEIANIILESKDTKDQCLRQCTKYYCYSDDKSKYLARSSNSGKTISEKSHNFQMGCVAEHSKKLIENGRMKLVHVGGNNVFIHANPSVESILCFLYIDEIKTTNDLNQKIRHYNDIFKDKNYKERLDGYFRMLDEINKVFIKLVADCKLDILDLNSIFFVYIGNSHDITKGEKCPKEMLPLSFFKKLKYFVGHDSRAKWEYTFNGSKLYCLDGHSKGNHRFANIVNDKVYHGSVKSNEFQREYLQQQINNLYSKIAEKYKQNSLNKKIDEETIYQEDEGLLENCGNAYAEMPDDKSGCICVSNGGICSAM